jgi:hypothetical protein
MIGIELRPPHAAAADVTFWLTAPQQRVVALPLGSEVATERTDVSDAIVFRTSEPLDIVPCHRAAAASAPILAGLLADEKHSHMALVLDDAGPRRNWPAPELNNLTSTMIVIVAGHGAVPL